MSYSSDCLGFPCGNGWLCTLCDADQQRRYGKTLKDKDEKARFSQDFWSCLFLGWTTQITSLETELVEAQQQLISLHNCAGSATIFHRMIDNRIEESSQLKNQNAKLQAATLKLKMSEEEGMAERDDIQNRMDVAENRCNELHVISLVAVSSLPC